MESLPTALRFKAEPYPFVLLLDRAEAENRGWDKDYIAVPIPRVVGEAAEQRFQAALDCYLSAISGIRDALEVTPELTEAHGLSLESLQQAISASPALEELAESRSTLIREMADYQSETTVYLAKKEEDLRAMLGSLVEAAETRCGRNDRQSDGLKKFTHYLHLVARGTDLAQMRRDLAKRVAELKTMQEELSRNNNGIVADMRKQLAKFQERLEVTEKRAATDSLTGLLNRGEGESKLVARHQGGQPFSVILVDLDDFKQINDQFGHVSGDQVLKTLGHVFARYRLRVRYHVQVRRR